MFISPAVAGSTVFIGSCSGAFFALDAATGEIAWSHDTSVDGEAAQFHGDALITDRLVVVGSDSRFAGHLYAFERDSGVVAWKHSFLGGVSAQVLRHGDMALALATSGDVVAISLTSGEIRWLYSDAPDGTISRLTVDPALEGDRLFVGWRQGYVEALAVDTGERAWHAELGALVNTALVATPSGIVVGTIDGTLHQLSPDDGTVRAQRTIDSMVYGDLVVSKSCLLALSRNEDQSAHTLSCLADDLSTVRWSVTSAHEWSTFRPVIEGDRVILGSKGRLIAIDLASGTIVWSCPIDGLPRGLASIDGQLYVGTLRGVVTARPLAACAAPTGKP